MPYWDWITDPVLPAFLSDPALLSSWSVTQSWDPTPMPVQVDVDVATSRHTFNTSQHLAQWPTSTFVVRGVHRRPWQSTWNKYGTNAT